MAPTLSIETGFRCNNRCEFCYQLGWRRGGKISDPDFKTLAGKLEWGARNGYDAVGFSGGEPSIRRDFVDLVRRACELGYRRISLTTNGRRLSNRDFAGQLLEGGVNSIGWSLHGPNPELHDSLVRRQGAFRQLMSGMRNVAALSQETGKHVDQNLFTLVTRHNRDSLAEIGRLGRDHGIKLSVLQPVIYSKGNLALAATYSLELDELVRAVLKAAEAARRGGWFVKLFNLPVCLFSDVIDAFEHQRYPVDVFRIQERKAAGETLTAGNGYVRLDRCRDCLLEEHCPGLHQSLLPQETILDIVRASLGATSGDIWLSGLELLRPEALTRLLLEIRRGRPDAGVKLYHGGDSVAGEQLVGAAVAGGATELSLVLQEETASGTEVLGLAGGNAATLALLAGDPLLGRTSFLRLSLAISYRTDPGFPSPDLLGRFASLGVQTLEVHFPPDFKQPEVFEAVKCGRLLGRWLKAGGRDLRLVLPEGRPGTWAFRAAAPVVCLVSSVGDHLAAHFFSGPGGGWASSSVPPSVRTPAAETGSVRTPILSGIAGYPIDARLLDRMRAG